MTIPDSIPPALPPSAEDRALRASMEVAERLEAFLGSQAGRALVSSAKTDQEDAFQAFLTCDPADVVKIRAIQMKAQVAEMALAYIRDAIIAGDNAKSISEAQGFVDP